MVMFLLAVALIALAFALADDSAPSSAGRGGAAAMGIYNLVTLVALLFHAAWGRSHLTLDAFLATLGVENNIVIGLAVMASIVWLGKVALDLTRWVIRRCR